MTLYNTMYNNLLLIKLVWLQEVHVYTTSCMHRPSREQKLTDIMKNSDFNMILLYHKLHEKQEGIIINFTKSQPPSPPECFFLKTKNVHVFVSGCFL